MQLDAIFAMNSGWVITSAQGSAALFQRRVSTGNMNPIISDRTTRRVAVVAGSDFFEYGHPDMV